MVYAILITERNEGEQTMKKHYTIRPMSIIWWAKQIFDFVIAPALFAGLLLGFCWLLG